MNWKTRFSELNNHLDELQTKNKKHVNDIDREKINFDQNISYASQKIWTSHDKKEQLLLQEDLFKKYEVQVQEKLDNFLNGSKDLFIISSIKDIGLRQRNEIFHEPGSSFHEKNKIVKEKLNNLIESLNCEISVTNGVVNISWKPVSAAVEQTVINLYSVNLKSIHPAAYKSGLVSYEDSNKIEFHVGADFTDSILIPKIDLISKKILNSNEQNCMFLNLESNRYAFKIMQIRNDKSIVVESRLHFFTVSNNALLVNLNENKTLLVNDVSESIKKEVLATTAPLAGTMIWLNTQFSKSFSKTLRPFTGQNMTDLKQRLDQADYVNKVRELQLNNWNLQEPKSISKGVETPNNSFNFFTKDIYDEHQTAKFEYKILDVLDPLKAVEQNESFGWQYYDLKVLSKEKYDPDLNKFIPVWRVIFCRDTNATNHSQLISFEQKYEQLCTQYNQVIGELEKLNSLSHSHNHNLENKLNYFKTNLISDFKKLIRAEKESYDKKCRLILKQIADELTLQLVSNPDKYFLVRKELNKTLDNIADAVNEIDKNFSNQVSAIKAHCFPVLIDKAKEFNMLLALVIPGLFYRFHIHLVNKKKFQNLKIKTNELEELAAKVNELIKKKNLFIEEKRRAKNDALQNYINEQIKFKSSLSQKWQNQYEKILDEFIKENENWISSKQNELHNLSTDYQTLFEKHKNLWIELCALDKQMNEISNKSYCAMFDIN